MNELVRNDQGKEIVGEQEKQLQSTIAREVEETRLRMMVAQKNRRRMVEVDEDITYVCKKFKMGEKAMYVYPRGGQTITGPSVHLAKEIATVYGHIDFGYRETKINDEEVRVETYCVDLQNNIKESRTFTVHLSRFTKKNGKTILTDPRDQYELVANYAARRVRACILGVIPSHIIDRAIEVCENTLREGDGKMSHDQRIEKMVAVFRELKVGVEDLEQRLGHKIEATIPAELVALQKIFTSLRDGASSRGDWFEAYVKTDSGKVADLNEKLKSKPEEKSEAKKK